MDLGGSTDRQRGLRPYGFCPTPPMARSVCLEGVGGEAPLELAQHARSGRDHAPLGCALKGHGQGRPHHASRAAASTGGAHTSGGGA